MYVLEFLKNKYKHLILYWMTKCSNSWNRCLVRVPLLHIFANTWYNYVFESLTNEMNVELFSESCLTFLICLHQSLQQHSMRTLPTLSNQPTFSPDISQEFIPIQWQLSAWNDCMMRCLVPEGISVHEILCLTRKDEPLGRFNGYKGAIGLTMPWEGFAFLGNQKGSPWPQKIWFKLQPKLCHI